MMKFDARYASISALLLATGCAQVPVAELAEQPAPPASVAAVAVIADAPAVTTPAPAAVAVVTPEEPPAKEPPRDIWERLRSGFAMTPMDNELVRNWEAYYSGKPEYFARMVERGSHYLFHIAEEIERRKLPAEIALLPMIESAYNPQAYSRAHASGLWQFIPSTGKLYGLRQNWWYDGRRDVIAATGAALDYLEKLYAQFNDWELALASYNWGEGAVARAVTRNQAKGLSADYASLTMPAETRNYLPKLIAVKNIIANPARFGISLTHVPNEPYFETITIKRHIDVKLAAKFANMPLDEFKFLNPAHHKAVIKAGEDEKIVLPRDRVALFHANLDKHEEPLVSWQAHTIKAGEKPEKIAAKYGISLNELKRVNNIAGRKKFHTGLALLVPVKAGTTPNLPDLPAAPVTMAKAYKAVRNKNAKRTTRTSGTKATTKQVAAVRKPAPAKAAEKNAVTSPLAGKSSTRLMTAEAGR